MLRDRNPHWQQLKLYRCFTADINSVHGDILIAAIAIHYKEALRPLIHNKISITNST